MNTDLMFSSKTDMCFYGARCYGTQAICINGTMITLPINEIKLEENDDE